MSPTKTTCQHTIVSAGTIVKAKWYELCISAQCVRSKEISRRIAIPNGVTSISRGRRAAVFKFLATFIESRCISHPLVLSLLRKPFLTVHNSDGPKVAAAAADNRRVFSGEHAD